MEGDTFLRELLLLLPFFILHVSSGMSGSFTTVLIEHYEKMNKTGSSSSSEAVREAMIGTFQDIPPILVAVLGGFLQQLFGPRKLLIVSAVPSLLSWLLVAAAPFSFTAILTSRLMAGFSNGLLTGNVYLVNIASTNNIPSLKMLELASKNVGSILMFAGMLSLQQLGIDTASGVFAFFPFIGLVGMFLTKESPLFHVRQKMSRSKSLEENESPFKVWLLESLARLKVPINSPTVYRPLVLITSLLCLLQCSGSVFIKKFIIQILASNSGDTLIVENSNLTSRVRVSQESQDNLNYYLPLIILSVRLAVIFLMAFMVKKLRIRFLYFLSLFMTVIVLASLGIVSDGHVIDSQIPVKTKKFIKTFLICLHVFFIQFGLNTLPALLIDILFPTSCKAVMKGITRAISSLILVFFVFIFKNLDYSHAFYLMAAILFLSSPFLYLFVPEIRNVGTEMSAEFFLPSQTVFYFVLPNIKGSKHSRQKARKNWKSAVRKISVHNAFIKEKVNHEIEVDVSARKFTTVRFDDAIRSVSEIYENDKFAQINRERINFVSNVLGQGSLLSTSPSQRRILIGRGPVRYVNELMKKGSIFLFNDILIVAKCVVSNRRYVGEICFKLDTLNIVKSSRTITLSDSLGKTSEIQFDDEMLASLWEKYLSFWLENQESEGESQGLATHHTQASHV